MGVRNPEVVSSILTAGIFLKSILLWHTVLYDTPHNPLAVSCIHSITQLCHSWQCMQMHTRTDRHHLQLQHALHTHTLTDTTNKQGGLQGSMLSTTLLLFLAQRISNNCVTLWSVCRCTHELTDTTCSMCSGSMHCTHTLTDTIASQILSHICDLTVCSCRWWTGTMHLSKRASGPQDRLRSRCAEKRHSKQLGCGPKHVRQSKLKELSSKLTCKEKGAPAIAHSARMWTIALPLDI